MAHPTPSSSFTAWAWHPVSVLVALVCAIWEFCFTPARATLVDLVLGLILTTWFFAAGRAYAEEKENTQ